MRVALGTPHEVALGRYAEVAVGAGAGASHTFTYSIPTSLALEPGHLVWVPFGRRTVPGIVFALAAETNAPYTRDVLGTLDPQPVLAPRQLALAQWMSKRYLAPLYACAALMLPPGFAGRSQLLLSLTPLGASHDLSDLSVGQRRVVERLRGRRQVSQEVLRRAMGSNIERAVANLAQRGLVERAWRWYLPGASARLRSVLELTSEGLVRPDLVTSLQEARAPRQAQLLEHLLDAAAPLEMAEARRDFGAAAVRGLLQRGWAVERHTLRDPDPVASGLVPRDVPPHLLPEQAQTLQRIAAALDDPAETPRSFLLHGVTGSGKTEVYLRALAHTLLRGKRGVVLVPEISLTPQMVQRFAARFPGRVAVLHSGLTGRQHHDEWWRIHRGEADVVIGPRSALFAPQPELGLVVLDEEHEWTYKQQDTPRYHAREAALELGRLTGAVVVMGSATPDVCTFYSAQSGQHTLVELPHRIEDDGHAGRAPAPLAAVEVVDMREELRQGNRGIFSRSLQAALRETVAAGQQALLFLNRRGSATHVQCRDCGFTQRCRRCAVALTYHAPEERLVCHQCGGRQRVPLACPSCWSRRIRFLGVGTQRVVEEVQRLLPGVETLRWDRDAVAARGSHQRLMEQFQEGRAQVLVGTQMIAKGLHFPAVTLVGVLLADLGLSLPDFRAGERVFQLLCQVVGRAGRGPGGGQAVIQTYDPTHYAVADAAAQDYLAFYQREIEFRRRYRQPPFWRLARLLFHHTNQAFCQREAARVGRVLGHQLRGGADGGVIGPAPAFPERVRGHYRWHLLLRTQGDPVPLLAGLRLQPGWTVDIDPVSLT